jgi:hypothetical protein
MGARYLRVNTQFIQNQRTKSEENFIKSKRHMNAFENTAPIAPALDHTHGWASC